MNIEHTRDKFKAFINEVSNGEVDYSESSIKKAFAQLTKKGLLRQVSRGVYKVNPEYFVKNDDAKRFELIKIELEFKEGIDTKLDIIKKENNVNETQPYVDETD
jgi:predicted transcriptional regulator of viral defense system